MNHRTLVGLAWAGAMLLGLALILTLFQGRQARRQVEAAAHARSDAAAKAAARKFDQELSDLETVAHRLRLDLERGALPSGSLPGRVAAALAKAPGACLELGVALGAVPGQGVGGAEASREGGRVHPVPMEALGPAAASSAWGERRLLPEGGTLVVDYVEPFHLPGSQAAGQVHLAIGLEALRGLVATAEAGAPAYGFLLSAQGVYLADPRTGLVHAGRTIQEEAESLRDPGRRHIGALARQGLAGFAEGVSAMDGRKIWMQVEPLPRAHWSLATVFLKDEVVVPPRTTRTLVIRMVSLGVGLALTLLFLALTARNASLNRLWTFSVSGSVVIALGCATLWYFAYTLPQEVKGTDIPVVDQGSLQAFLAQHASLDAGVSEVAAELIPTGVFVETLEFLGGGQVRVTGKVWQRFRKDGPREARGGVAFPEAVSEAMEPPVVREEGREVVQFSSFRVVLNQKLVSSPTYPFDHARVRLWLRQKAMWRNELLVPDMGSYLMLLPDTLPGVDREMAVLGWKLERSFFSYMLQNYNANFGMDDYVGQQKQPELLFTLTMRRDFLNPFIATFLPIMAVLGLMFAATMTISRHPDRVKATTYQCLNLLRTVVSLFFPVVLAQINLRSRIDADRVIYLEHYYFVVYGLILMVAADALLFALTENRILAYEDNALPKLAFWPLVMGCFYLVSIRFLL